MLLHKRLTLITEHSIKLVVTGSIFETSIIFLKLGAVT